MFDVNKILNVKKNNKFVKFSDLSLSKTLGKNPLSNMINNVTKRPLHNLGFSQHGASQKLQNQWKQFSVPQRQQMRTRFKDSDGDRIPDRWDCSPNNTMRQDKTFWPQKLKDNNITFDETVSPKKQRIIEKRFRKNPQLLAQKEQTSDVVIGIDDTQKQFNRFGVTRALNKDKEIYNTKRDSKEDVALNKYHVTLGKQMFNSKYDPEFTKFVEKINPNITEEEKLSLAYKQKRQYKNNAFNDVNRTLSHEFKHVNQIEDGHEGNFNNFFKDYKLDMNRYEEDADKFAFDQQQMRTTEKFISENGSGLYPEETFNLFPLDNNPKVDPDTKE